MSGKNESNSFIHKLSTFIVDKRHLFFLFYIAALVFSLFSVRWVNVENDVTKYLPEDTETRRGVETMNEHFVAFGTARVMVSNITYETAESLYHALQEIPGVEIVQFDDSADHYKDAAALYDVNFSAGTNDEISLAAMDDIRNLLSSYDYYVDTLVGYNENETLAKEMGSILALGAVIILGVLLFTSRAYAEVIVLLLTFGVAALLNIGTNFIFKKISFISDSVAVVLQLALAIDYAIIMCHRFSDENETLPVREACIVALRKSIPEISASSLTTISGMLALGFMKFGIGLDISLVMIKAILLSLISVFTLMPGLLILFSSWIERTKHPKLIPNISSLGRFAVKTRRFIPPVFALVVIASFWLSSQCPYCYGIDDMKTPKMTERQAAYFKIKETFGTSNMLALVVPAGDYEAEAAILEELESRPEVESAMGLANIEAMDGHKLADALTPRELSELMGLDYEVVQLLYSAYAVEHNQYGSLLGGVENYKVPMFHMFMYLKDQLETRNITLGGEDQAEMDDMFAQLENARIQMQSEKYSRMVLTLNLPLESEETFAFLDEIRSVMGEYYEDGYYVVGTSTSSRDLAKSFDKDNLVISILSALFVIIVLLFTFRSVGMPILLIFVIQGSIWINFSIPTLTNQPLYFLGYLIVTAIQMGANIDYAIVISSHYLEQKKYMPHKEAIVVALNAAFPTVFTSGGIVTIACFLIDKMTAQPVIAIMGNCLARGTFISIILVLGVLPAILVLGDSIIERTRFIMKGVMPEKPAVKKAGEVKLHGRVKGFVSGEVDADIFGVVRGEIHAVVSTRDAVSTVEEGEKNHAED